ncbi:hypothetical protein GCM10010176_101160 [Nonomuraea spiralis]|nr:hypothetical protein GCM10010176_101160 [Nonomuraea spiralis]
MGVVIQSAGMVIFRFVRRVPAGRLPGAFPATVPGGPARLAGPVPLPRGRVRETVAWCVTSPVHPLRQTAG